MDRKIERKNFFKMVPARVFFKQYAPTVKNFYHKTRGFDGNKKPIDFTNQDVMDINAGIKRMANDLRKMKF